MSEPAMDLRASRVLLRRRRRLLIGAAVVGLVAGSAYVAFVPAKVTSTALVLLPTPTTSSQAPDTASEVSIATSSSVLAAAGKTLTPSRSAEEVKKQVDVSAPTERVIRIDASAVHDQEAQQLSHAVADAYVAFVRNTVSAVASPAVRDLRERQAILQAQVAALQKEIDATTQRHLDKAAISSARREAQLLAALQTEQANVSLQLDKVKDGLAAGVPGQQNATQQIAVIQGSTPAVGPALYRRLLTWLPAGAAVCVILIGLIVLLAGRRARRVVLRDDIADAIGSPVLAAVRSQPQRTVSGWSTLLGTYEPSPTEAWGFRQALRALAPPDVKGQDRGGDAKKPWRIDHPLSVTLVSVSGDLHAVALGAQFAAFAASLGISTRLSAFGSDDKAASFHAALHADRASELRPSLYLSALPDDGKPDLTVVLATLDRGGPTLEGAPETDVTVVTVTPGSATAEELANVALAVDNAGRTVTGILVADPDPSDRTSGRRTLEERALQVPLPTRMTGGGGSGGPRREGR